MGEKLGILPSKNKMPGLGFFRNLFFFSFLVILPLCTLYFAFAIVQSNLEEQQQIEALDEMAEITAHMQRLADPQSFFQERLHRLSESFRWVFDPNEITAPAYEDATEIFLFDEKGKRISWQHGERGKIRISEDYLKLLIRAETEPGRLLGRREQAIAASFSGNAATIYSLGKAPGTLVNFQGLGLRKFGAWFKPRLSGRGEGHLLAFINPDKVSNFHLAERAIRKIQRLAGKPFRFAWIDLDNSNLNSCTGGVKLKEEGRRLLSLTGLKSGFKHEEMLFSVSDTPEGIRLICFRNLPKPPEVLDQYCNLLYTIIPVLILFFIWKTVFQIRLDLSVRLQFSLIFGYTALTGIVILLAGISAFQSEKQASLIAEQKHQAIRILEKIDRNFTASYGDLMRQYRHFNRLLNEPGAKPKEILAPLQKAQQEDSIAFASYVNQHGEFLFRAPEFLEEGNTTVLEVKYANLINSVSSQIIKTFNSSRQKGNLPGSDVIGVAAISSRPVQGLLHNRSTLQNIVFDGDETITFMDLTIKASDTVDGCLFIVHEPKKLQLKYLSSSGKTIADSTGFQLVAFPKKSAEKSSYFPRYSLTNELPLWKLQDLVNQTQVSSFKTGKIDDREVLVAATPGHNLRNFNLFLIMPMNSIQKDARQLTRIFLGATILAIVFIAFLSGMLIKSLIMPISRLAASASALNSKAPTIPENALENESNELDSIATGLTDLIIKVREFNDGHSIKRHLLPPAALEQDQIICDGFQLSMSNSEREIYHFAQIAENLTLIFLMRTDLDGIDGSINLSMARMAVRLISEELNVHSPYRILKDLEEYFRINLRRKLGGDFFLGLFNHEEGKIFWSGCGQIAAYLVAKGQITRLELPQTQLGSTIFHNFTSQENDFGEGMLAFIVSPTLAQACSEKLTKLLPSLNNLDHGDITGLKQKLQKEAEISCAGKAIDSASLLLALGRKLQSKDKPDDSAKQ
jgi:hypothetical protein